MVKILQDDQTVIEADDFNGALAVYKSQNPTHLVYPHVDKTEIHVRVPDDNGDFLDVTVLQVQTEIEGEPNA